MFDLTSITLCKIPPNYQRDPNFEYVSEYVRLFEMLCVYNKSVLSLKKYNYTDWIKKLDIKHA